MSEERKPHGPTPEPDRFSGSEVANQRVLQLLRESLGAIRYGQLVLTIHDGVVVQFEKVEKLRLR